MGYTHYWHRKNSFTKNQWERIRKDFQSISDYCRDSQIIIAEEHDKSSPPLCDGANIRFNGYMGEGHETFFMPRILPEPQPWDRRGEHFDFCKTARKPYDIAVCLTLLACVRHAPDTIRLGSDGDWDGDWVEARRVFGELFGIEAENPFEEEAVA